MRFLRFLDKGGNKRIGILKGSGNVVVASGSPFYGLQETDESIALGEIKTFLAPVDPPNIMALGLNYRKHAEESGSRLPDHPMLFIKATSSLIGHKRRIVLPAAAPDEVDYECELAVVIGRTARNVTPEQAPDYVLGYTCANDVSARDCQLRLDIQWARAKSFDTFCPLGPWVDTDFSPASGRIMTRLNGEVMQDSDISDLIFNPLQVVSFLSQGITLWPGTVIMTGTPGGVGFARKPPVFLRAGDEVEIEIEGLGTLSNPVVAEAE